MVMVSATAWRWLRKRSKAKLWKVFTWGTVEPWGGPALGPPYVEHNRGTVEPWGWRGWTSQPKMCQGVDHQTWLKSVQSWGFYPWPPKGLNLLAANLGTPGEIHFKSISNRPAVHHIAGRGPGAPPTSHKVCWDKTLRNTNGWRLMI